MSRNSPAAAGTHPVHGQLAYLQLPAVDLARSAAFYAQVFGWAVDTDHGSFEAPGMIGQWTTDLAPGRSEGPVLWLGVDRLGPTLVDVDSHGGVVVSPPQLDQGERWLAEVADPAGNRIGLVSRAGVAESQTLIAVRDVEAASAWYQQVLGLESDHGGPHYERLLSDGRLVLQLHDPEVEHHHGRIGDPGSSPGGGVLLWFGEVTDFDGAVERARRLGATFVHEPHRNPPSGEGNGPGHREVWIKDLDGYTVVVASPDGEAFES